MTRGECSRFIMDVNMEMEGIPLGGSYGHIVDRLQTELAMAEFRAERRVLSRLKVKLLAAEPGNWQELKHHANEILVEFKLHTENP